MPIGCDRQIPQDTLHRAALLAASDIVEIDDLTRWTQRPKIQLTPQQGTHDTPSRVLALDEPDGQPKTLERIEQEVIELTLARYNAHIGKAAAALSIGQSTLYKRLRA